jgi:hypothetical protein
MLLEWRRKDIQGLYRKIDDEAGAEYVRMRSIAIWEAQDTMERGELEATTLPLSPRKRP